MTTSTNPLSTRFFPAWNNIDIYQTIGLIEMVLHIHQNHPNAEHWLEIGSNIGESATIFLGFPQTKKLHCVDIHKSSIELLQRKFLKEMSNGRCFVHHSSSADFALVIPDNSMDVVYIDADHSYESAKEDISLYLNKVKSGGFICGHDYNNGSWPGVVKAVDELSAAIKKDIIVFQDTSWLMKKD
jgi:predicted O-methyltransferase YrrM